MIIQNKYLEFFILSNGLFICIYRSSSARLLDKIGGSWLIWGQDDTHPSSVEPHSVRTPRTRAFVSLVCSMQSHLSLSLLMDPVSELHHLRVDAGAVQPRAALTPAHDPCQEPPPATLQTYQRAPGVTLGEKTSHINLSAFT